MKKLSTVLLAAVLAVSCACPLGVNAQSAAPYSSSSQENSTVTQQSAIKSAEDFVQLLYSGKYDAAAQNLDAAVLKIYNADSLKADWESIAPRLGTYLGKISAQYAEQNGIKAVIVTSAHEYYNLYVYITFDANGKIQGLLFRYAVNENLAPEIFISGGVKQIHFDLVSGQYKLPAVLTMPASGKNFPAAVMLSGSGSNDRDEYIEGNRPFEDIANGLAQKGIATLRFDKRTFAYAVKNLTEKIDVNVDNEYKQDAASAVNFLLNYQGIDHSRIYLLGHSEGASLTPRLALSIPKVKGLIMLAGTPRNIEDSLLDQIAEKDPSAFDYVKKEVEKIEAYKKDSSAQNGTLLGMSYAYYKDVDSHDEVADAIKSGKPMLILQGERDTQVFMKDFNLWKQGFLKKSDVVYKTYPKLNHLFMEETGKPAADEYANPGHVAPYAIDDIVSFIKDPTAANGAAGISQNPAGSKSAHIENPKTGNDSFPEEIAIAVIAAAALLLNKLQNAFAKQ